MKDKLVSKYLRRIIYRKAGDFLALAPPQNDEVEIIGHFYKRPSSKLQDKEEDK